MAGPHVGKTQGWEQKGFMRVRGQYCKDLVQLEIVTVKSPDGVLVVVTGDDVIVDGHDD